MTGSCGGCGAPRRGDQPGGRRERAGPVRLRGRRPDRRCGVGGRGRVPRRVPGRRAHLLRPRRRPGLDLPVDALRLHPLRHRSPRPPAGARGARRGDRSRRPDGLRAALGVDVQPPRLAPYTSITRRRFLGMGAGSSSFAGRDFYVNHFGVATYAEAVEHDRLPVARWLHLGRWGGAAYDTFWQAYAGGVDRPRALRVLRHRGRADGARRPRAAHAGGLLRGVPRASA